MVENMSERTTRGVNVVDAPSSLSLFVVVVVMEVEVGGVPEAERQRGPYLGGANGGGRGCPSAQIQDPSLAARLALANHKTLATWGKATEQISP